MMIPYIELKNNIEDALYFLNALQTCGERDGQMHISYITEKLKPITRAVDSLNYTLDEHRSEDK